MPKMRAKMIVTNVEAIKSAEDEVLSERLTFRAVGPNGSYPADGSDEDNTYAKFSPQADLSITVANSALFGHFEPGQKYYIDFTRAN